MIQGTEGWMRWRHAGIGGSDASVIMGVSRFSTIRELWKEKIQAEPPENDSSEYIRQKGHRLEAKVRAQLELEDMEKWTPICAEWEADPRYRCSLDGKCGDKILEVKFYGREKFLALERDKEIPVEAYPQIQFNLMVTGAKVCLFTIVNDNHNDKSIPKGEIRIARAEVKADKEYITQKLFPACELFLKSVDKKVPPPHGIDDFMEVREGELAKKMEEYKLVAERKKVLEKDIYALAGQYHNKIWVPNVGKITLSQTEDREEPDYKKFCIEKGLEVDCVKKIKGRLTKRITL